MKTIRNLITAVVISVMFSFKGENQNTGSVSISASWTTPDIVKKLGCSPFIVVISFSNGGNITENEYIYSPATMNASRLSPGNYQYSVTKTYNSKCGRNPGVTESITKNGTFGITSGQTTNVSVRLD